MLKKDLSHTFKPMFFLRCANIAPRCFRRRFAGSLGAYLGGKAFQWTGNYDWMWYADIVLAIGAALIHLPIRELAAAPRAVAAA